MEKRVFAAVCRSYERDELSRAVDRIFEAWGGVQVVLKNGPKIVVKPNLLMAREPDLATTTHPVLVELVAEKLVKNGADVTIADSPGGPYNEIRMNRVYRACGMDDAAARSGAKLNHDWTHEVIEYPGFENRQFHIISPIAEADAVVDIAKMKTHLMTYFTGAVKNMFGSIAGLEKAAWHSRLPKKEDFCRMIVDLCQCVNPVFCIIDGINGMDGKGPSGGRVRSSNVLFASTNPFAADLAAMHYCGLDPELAPIHNHGAKLRLVPEKYEDLVMMGDELKPLDEPFVPPAKGIKSDSFVNYLPRFMHRTARRLFVPFPQMSQRCIGCGECARACPRQAITVENGKARVDKTKCIQCYCCHELCPIKAVELK